MMRLVKWLIVLAILGAGGWYGTQWVLAQTRKGPTEYNTAQVHTGELVTSITATGTIEPEDLIDVGAQVAGQILEFGKDTKNKTIDYGSNITSGQLLARIDDTVYKANLIEAEAGLAGARSDLQRSKADLGQLQAKLDQAQRDWDRAQKLGPSEALAQTSYDAYRSSFEVAKANIEVGKAAIKQGESGVVQAQANVDRALRNLSYCTIKSPVDGIIIDRRVNIGQTVVASLNAPSLFLIAKDLKQVQIWVAVNEADIGSIHAGQPVAFTVDAFPDDHFRGEVGKIRLNASMTQNVVTYTVEVDTDNSAGRLLPYLTANVQFETARRDDVLLAPNSALRWTPTPEMLGIEEGKETPGAGGERKRGTDEKQSGEPKPDDKGEGKENAGDLAAEPARNMLADAEGTSISQLNGDRKGGASGRKGRRGGGGGRGGQAGNRGTLWTLENGQLKSIMVRTGITNGSETEVSGPDASEGLTVVTGVKITSDQAQAAGGAKSPFMPQFKGGGRGGGGGGGRRGGG